MYRRCGNTYISQSGLTGAMRSKSHPVSLLVALEDLNFEQSGPFDLIRPFSDVVNNAMQSIKVNAMSDIGQYYCDAYKSILENAEGGPCTYSRDVSRCPSVP